MTDARVSQLAREALRGGSAEVRFSNLAREALRGGGASVRVSGVAREVLHGFPTPARFSGLAREVLMSSLGPPAPAAGQATWAGRTPITVNPATVDVPVGSATWAGGTPQVSTLPPVPPGQAKWVGRTPVITNAEATGFQWQATVISQYQCSPTLNRLIENLDEYIDPAGDFEAFYGLVWNVDTAQGWGLDVWGRIVGVTRVLHVSATAESFGFEEGGTTDYTGFGRAPFYGGGFITSNFSLSDPAFRTLILAKALANITDGSIPALNQILLNLFPGRGNCYVVDGNDMTMTYTFTFVLTPVERAIVAQSGVLPKSTGVAQSVVTP